METKLVAGLPEVKVRVTWGRAFIIGFWGGIGFMVGGGLLMTLVLAAAFSGSG